MDEPRIVANQRLDLVDLTRWLAANQDAFEQILRMLGNPNYYTGAAEDHSKAPLIANSISVAHTTGLTLSCSSSWTYGGSTYAAFMFDGNGRRLVGPNSTTPQIYVAPASPGSTDRYLIARRAVSQTTNEARQFFSAAAGKYPQNTDTENYDDWEVSESLFEGGLVNALASTNATLRDAGWVDIATFQTNGVDSIPQVTDYVDTTANVPNMVYTLASGIDPFSWTGLNVAPDELIHNLGGIILAMQMILMRMRAGSSSLSALREWFMNPGYDAAFDEEGGLRLAAGQTAGSGLVNTHIRAQEGGGAYDSVVVQSPTVTDADDLHFIRAKGFVAGDDTALGAPAPATNVGYLYSTEVDGIADGLTAVGKPWDINPALWAPTDQAIDPWSAATGPTDNVWHRVASSSNIWSMNVNTAGADTSSVLVIPVQVPNGCLLTDATISGEVMAVFPDAVADDLQFTAAFGYRSRFTGTYSVHCTHVYGYSDGAPWSNIASPRFHVYAMEDGTDSNLTIDNYTNTYQMLIYFTSNAAVASDIYVELDTANVLTLIREASHVY